MIATCVRPVLDAHCGGGGAGAAPRAAPGGGPVTIIEQAAQRAIDSYQQGRADGYQDAVDECAQRHMDRIADVLDVIDHHHGDREALRAGILAALGHDTGGAA